MKQEMYGSGISWTICKQSAPRSRQITTPTPHHSTTTSVSHHISSSLCCRFSVFSDSERLCHCCQLPNNFGLCWIFRIFHNGLEDAPKTCPFPRGTWAPCALPWAQPSLQQPNWHFSRFCSFKCSSWLCPSVTQTTPACMRCSLVLQDAEEAVVHSDLH